MAFQIQYPPQTPNPFQSFMGGWNAMSESQVRGLEKQLLKRDIDAYDQRLNAELAQMLAQTEQAEAATALSQTKTAGEEFQNLLAQQYGEQALLTDMLYKSGIAQASLNNAEVGRINAQIARERLPNELANLKFQNDLLKMKLEAWAQYQGGQQPSPGNIDVFPVGTPEAMNNYTNGQIPLPALSGMEPISFAQQETIIEPVKTSPRDYLPPKVEQRATPYELFVEPEVTTPSQRKFKEEYAGQSGREISKGYSAYANETAEEADKAGKQSVVLQNLRNSYGNTPEKGEVLGYLKAITSEAQLYEAFKSNAVMEVLALQKGVQGENDRVMLEKTFGGRTMDEAAMDELLTLTEIANDRLIQKNNELVSWEEGEGRSRGEVERAWQEYIKDHSIFDTARYQAFLRRKWSNMSPKERIKDEEKYLNMREEMLSIEINKAAGE